ncbi:uncharacterized protein C8Q71DRAFT_714513 [Rhodofomes roseus]|uniref:Uncharacterized protein n=1 Tax=Rhodofomes roseus TaxID=34475 RepID=A0ABQ8K611_9APHY|nr:uncharacterized protein C8Q71DRAFT_714513 [Rhodofomes roseus]KAH9832339.1 hypothetical protein C8Q71DRAFT_714513 [Rhodofomes roseus]
MQPFADHLREFQVPALANLHFAIARKDHINRSQYMLVCARPYGMAYDQRIVTLNESTSADEAPILCGPSGHPLIWFDCPDDLGTSQRVPGGLLYALLEARPTVLRLTGRTRKVFTDAGGLHPVREVEILLREEELARMCCYCGQPEYINGCDPVPYPSSNRFTRCGNDPTKPQYLCSTVRLCSV